jgi:hypothetical protein
MALPVMNTNRPSMITPSLTDMGFTMEGLKQVTPSSFAALGIGVRPPRQGSQWSPPASFYEGTLGNPMPSGPITSVPSWTTNASIPVNRNISFLPEFSGVRGAIGTHMIAFIHKGYTTPYGSQKRFVHNNERLENSTFSTPYKNVLLTMPMVNYMLIDLAYKCQIGEIKDKYSLEFVENMFIVDGVIETITGDETGPVSMGYGKREAYAAVLRSGRLMTKNIWGIALQAWTSLCVGLKKFDPVKIKDSGVPYSVDPSTISDGLSSNRLDEIISNNESGAFPKTWVYQFIPLPPYMHGYGFSMDHFDSKLGYITENNELEYTRPVQIGVVERQSVHSSTLRSFSSDVPPEGATCTAKLASTPTVDIYVNVI